MINPQTTRKRKTDKWVAEKMPTNHPYKTFSNRNWRVYNTRTGKECIVGADMESALYRANEMNLKGFMED